MASLSSTLPSVKKSKLLFLFAVAGLCLLGMARKQSTIIRFYIEANPRDTDEFSTKIELKNPPRQAFVEKIPTIHERMIKAIYPYEAQDGTWGCAFKLDESGRVRLE